MGQRLEQMEKDRGLPISLAAAAVAPCALAAVGHMPSVCPFSSDDTRRHGCVTDAQDVLLLCVQAARNKTFDVCYEAQTEAGNEMYELVSTLLQLQRSHLRQLLAAAHTWQFDRL